MTEPTYWDNALYVIRGDLIDLKRHVNALLADVGFCAEHNAVRAIGRIEDEASTLSSTLRRQAVDRFRATRREVSVHPRAAIMVCCLAGALTGLALYRALHVRPSRP